MIVEVKLFAVARQLAGSESISIELPSGANVGQLRRELVRAAPALERVAPMLLFALNQDYAGDDAVVEEASDVACIPPVSGG